MSFGKSLLCAIVKSGNKNYLNRINDDLLLDKPSSGDSLSEKQLLQEFRTHILSYRTLPTPDVLKNKGIEYVETTQPPEYYLEEIKKRAVYTAYKNFQRDITPHLQAGLKYDDVVPLIINFHNRVAKLTTADNYKSVKQLGKEIEHELEQRMNGAPEVFVPFGWETLDEKTGGAGAGDLCYFVARPGKGKAIAVYEPVLMADGSFKQMKDVSVGDKLASIDGDDNYVYGVHTQGVRPTYKVTFADGRSVDADEQHLWKVDCKYFDGPRIMSTIEVLRWMTKAKRYSKALFVETFSGVFGDSKPFIDPYTLGILIGDGSLTQDVRFTTMDSHITQMVNYNLLEGHTISEYGKKGEAIDYAIVNHNGKNQYKELLISRGLLGKKSTEKRLPDEVYLWSYEDRLALLRGLMDSDGTVSGSPTIGFSNKELLDDVIKLVRSLGGKAQVQKTKKTSDLDHYRCTIVFDRTEIFSLERKKSKSVSHTTHNPKHLRFESIEYIGEVETKCIGVTHSSRMFIVGDYIPTHNSQLITHMSYHAWSQGFSPLVLTMEMTDIQIARRLYGIKGGFNHDALRRGIPDSSVNNKLTESISAFENGPEFNVICGQVRQTVESITTLVDELKPDVLYIDAAYLINMKGSASSVWEKMAQVGEKLKELAISRNIPIILTVQFNRESTKNKNSPNFSLETIAGSDAIGQLGSVIVAIKDSMYENRRALEILKNREGGVAEFEINFKFDPPDFSEILVTAVETETEISFVV
jgi:replicative DNA helicase